MEPELILLKQKQTAFNTFRLRFIFSNQNYFHGLPKLCHLKFLSANHPVM